MITSASNTAPFQGSKASHDAWIIEAIWGHRIEEQPPYPMFLELLCMAESVARTGKLFEPTRPDEHHEYVPNQCLQLRNILFNNARLEEINEANRGNSSMAWAQWEEVLRSTAVVGDRLQADFKYLRERFDSFDEFVAVVKLLRRISLEQASDRAWPSRFLFPIGPAAIYEPLSEKKGGGFERVRTVFTRTGELAYLMLSRAADPVRSEIRDQLQRHFDYSTPQNALLMRLIENEEPDRGDPRSGTYLPYIHHPAFDRFAEDVLALLTCGLPGRDMYLHLVLLVPFHIYLYALETASEWQGKVGLPSMVCEILAPRRDLVRKASLASYLDNDALPTIVVDRQIELIWGSAIDVVGDAFMDLDDEGQVEAVEEALALNCALRRGKIEARSLDELRRGFRDLVLHQLRTGTGRGISYLSRSCGLSSRRGTNQYRYAPTDDLLRTLILVNASTETEESDMLARLHQRYGIIIGPSEAELYIHEALYDKSDFQKNRDRFGQRLIGLGLANRMSDACTYIHATVRR